MNHHNAALLVAADKLMRANIALLVTVWLARISIDPKWRLA